MYNPFELSPDAAAIALPVLALAFAVPFAGAGDRHGFWRLLGYLGLAGYLAALAAAILLPLGAAEDACGTLGSSATLQKVPFHWVENVVTFAREQGQRLTLQGLLHNSSLFQAVFNVALFVPLGVFLRLAFRRSLLGTVALGLLLSGFFELAQATGLFGIEDCARRVADTDDLVLNTFGAALGWLLGASLLPIPQIGEATPVVGAWRRFVAFACDIVLVEALLTLAQRAVNGFETAAYFAAFLVLAAMVFVVPVITLEGETFGKWLVGIRLTARNGRRLPTYRVVVRYAILIGLPSALVFWPQMLLPPELNDITGLKAAVFGATLVLLILVGPLPMLLRRDRRGLHDLIVNSGHVAERLGPIPAPLPSSVGQSVEDVGSVGVGQ